MKDVSLKGIRMENRPLVPKAAEMLRQGQAVSVVSKELGVSVGSIKNWKKAGLLKAKRTAKPLGKRQVRHETMEIPLAQEFQAVSTLTITGDPASLARFMKEIRS